MKSILFTSDEKTLIKLFLKKRLGLSNNYNEQVSQDKVENGTTKKSHLKFFLSVLAKISDIEITEYSTKEIDSIISCANENHDYYYSGLNLPNTLSWLSVSNQQRKVISNIDCCRDILFKCGYYNKKYSSVVYNTEFRYNDMLLNIEKIKFSDKVFLSKAGENNYYKIGFIYNNKEYLPFELKDKVSLDNTNFISLNGHPPEVFAPGKFSLIASRHNAKKLIANCNSVYYPDGVLDFINVLLT